MTIDSTWVDILKKSVPDAFTLDPPFTPQCVFIDGMLSLMRASHVRTWDQLVELNFCRHIRKYMSMGATTVVLGFDVYAHVPMAKSITQANRAKVRSSVDFTPGNDLPPNIPDNYEDCMVNRAFKVKVIAKVAENVERALDLPPGKRLVIDYEHYPVVSECKFQKGGNHPAVVKYLVEDVPEQGECDIKAWRWADMLGSTFAHSKDGDYIPIALVHHEKALRAGRVPPRMAILRGEYVTPRKPDAKRIKVPADQTKLSSLWKTQGAACVAATAAPRAVRKRNEYVDVGALYIGIIKIMATREVPESTRLDCLLRSRVYMQALVVLIGLGGTDFSRTAPR